jgi:hypothetical protein
MQLLENAVLRSYIALGLPVFSARPHAFGRIAELSTDLPSETRPL